VKENERPSSAALTLAFATVYLVWGSTYLAIQYAIATVPPLYMAGVRYVLAGLILLVYGFVTRAPKASLTQWRTCAIVGGLMLTCGNGAVTWAEQRVPSGLTALLLATVSLWIVLLNWGFGTRAKPTASQTGGLLIGLAGIALLVLPSRHDLLGKGVDVLGACVVLAGALSWASGTMYARGAVLPSSPWMTNGAEMLAGGVFLVIAGAVGGEKMHLSAVSTQSLLAFAYLVVFGSVVAFSAYTWLIKATTPARLGTYAYVNPAVAVLLGAVIAGEPVTPRALLAMFLILSGVVMLSLVRKPREAPAVGVSVEQCQASLAE